MECEDNEERIHKVPLHIREAIKAEALEEAVQRVEALGNEPQPNHGGDPYSWSNGYVECQRQAIAVIKGE